MKTKTLFAAFAALSIGVSAPALAHPKLVSSSPAASATVAATNRLTLTFSERLMQLSGIDLAMTGMPGMANHAPMKIGGVRTTVGRDGKTLIAALPRRLAAGTYKLDWHVVSVDTHRIAGSLTFTVR
ncbi:hypothetical protein B0I00_0554 [Novosphingobium kunmingense]|uniref:CopC domain-containing protein n=1 Tax=Novosphingobium kunmingense TaxID=1211806 RepID=A0A2N0I2D3_9SPHN|nr:copper homeostasis periplasmic binding protein CopC [Novosphingobium kunmingense]PKB25358.1 hypothetical protein B0I00_0554 [Novosphingobium kunmingense]